MKYKTVVWIGNRITGHGIQFPLLGTMEKSKPSSKAAVATIGTNKAKNHPTFGEPSVGKSSSIYLTILLRNGFKNLKLH